MNTDMSPLLRHPSPAIRLITLDSRASGRSPLWRRAAFYVAGAILFGFPSAVAAAAPSLPPAHGAFSAARLDSLTRLRVHYQFDTVYLEKAGNAAGWMVRGTGLAADDSMIAGARTLLAALHERDVVARTKSEAALERFGLDQVEAWGVEAGFASGRSESLLLSFRPDEQVLYWKRAARPEVYRVRNAPWRLSMTADDWKSRYLFPRFSLFDVHTIEVTWADTVGKVEGYKLLKVRSDSAVIVSPDTLPIHLKKASEIFVLTEQFAVDAFYGPGEAVSVGDSTPWRQIRLVLADGTVHAARAEGRDERYYHVRHPLGGTPVKIARFRFDKFRRTLAELTALPEYGPEAMDWAVEEDIKGIGVFAPHRESPAEPPEGGEGSGGDADPHKAHRH
jgi:hypothetical protein